MRIVDADRLITILKGFGEWSGEESTFRLGIASAREIIENAPTVSSKDCCGCKHEEGYKFEREHGFVSPCAYCMRITKDNYQPIKEMCEEKVDESTSD